MSIVVLNITEEGRGGGPLKRIKDVAQTLQADQIVTKVVLPKKGSDQFLSELEEANVPAIDTSLHRLTKEKVSLLKYVITFLPEVWKLRSIIKKQHTDIVLCNGSWQIKGIIAAKLARKKSIWIQNDSQQPKAVQKLFAIVSNWADAFVFVSQRTKDYYSQINPSINSKPNVVIQSPVDTEKFRPEKNSGLLKEDGTNILSVGYINNNKGFDTLIRAMALVNEKNKENIHCHIAGPVFDSQQQYYSYLLKIKEEKEVNNLHFLGMRKDIPALLNSADIYVCSSDFEASPISVWEALSAGKPVISTDVGDVPEIFETNNCGVVVPSKNPEKLASAILDMVDQKEERAKYRSIARQTAQNSFSVASISKQYLAFYRLINQLPH